MPAPDITQVLANPKFQALDTPEKKNLALKTLFPVLSDPRFQALDSNKKKMALSALYPSFQNLSPSQQDNVINGFQQSLGSKVAGLAMNAANSILQSSGAAGELVKGAAKGLLQTSDTVSNLLSFGAEHWGERNAQVTSPDGKKESAYDAEQELYKPSNKYQQYGKVAEGVAEAFVPIPGLEAMGPVRLAEDVKAAKAALKAAEASGDMERIRAAEKALQAVRPTRPVLARIQKSAVRAGVDTGVREIAHGGNAKDTAQAAAVGAVLGPIADELPAQLSYLLKKNAARLYEKMIAPSRGFQAEKTKELIEKGIQSQGKKSAAWTKKGLESKFIAQARYWANQINEAWNAMPDDEKINGSKIVNAYAKGIEKRFLLSGSGHVTNEDIYRAYLQPLIDFIRRGVPKLSKLSRDKLNLVEYILSTGINRPGDAQGITQLLTDAGQDLDKMTAKDLRQFRQEWDRAINYERSTSRTPGSLAEEIIKNLSDTAREEISKQKPDIGRLNAKFHFWQDAATLIGKTLPVGRTSYFETLSKYAAGVGAMSWLGALTGYEVGGRGKEYALESGTGTLALMTWFSTARRSGSAALQAKLADALVSDWASRVADAARREGALHFGNKSRQQQAKATPQSVVSPSAQSMDTDTFLNQIFAQ